MIVTCPACQTRYLVDDAALGGEAGRRMRCASCGNVWSYSPEAEAIQQAIAEVTASAEAAAVAEAPGTPTAVPSQVALERPGAELRADTQAPGGPTAVGRPPVEVALPAAAKRRRARVAGLVLSLVVAIVLVVGILGRERIMTRWPQTTPVYSAARLADPISAGLEVTVKPTRTSDSLMITGDIVNSATVARRIPRLRVSLRDGNKAELDSRVIDPPVVTLPPGATVHFDTVFEHPSITATGVAVTFAAQ
jgi:predicted Zn finger-like uncharacterized protein